MVDSPFDGLKGVKTITEAEKAAGQRALEQRAIVLNDIEERFFLEINPHTREWDKVYGFNPGPVVPASIVLTTNDFVRPFPAASGSPPWAAPSPVGTPGISSITSEATTAGTGVTYSFAGTPTDTEIEIARFPLGVGTDIAFLKSKYPRGDINYATKIYGYMMASGEGGSAGLGFMNNGTIKLKVVDSMDMVAFTILECSTAKFNAGSQARVDGGESLSVNPDLNFTVWPNMQDSELITEGSSLVVSITGFNERDSYDLVAGGTATLAPRSMWLDGSQSKIYIETTRLIYLDAGTIS